MFKRYFTVKQRHITSMKYVLVDKLCNSIFSYFNSESNDKVRIDSQHQFTLDKIYDLNKNILIINNFYLSL
jgi:hypothetical protein